MAIGRKIMLAISGKTDKLLMILTGTAGGLVLAQFPQYLAQYLQRLGGHIDEARHIAESYRLVEVARRAHDLANGLQAIQTAHPLWKLPAFIINVQWDVALQVYNNFSPGMTFNQVELIYLFVGCIVGWMVYGFVKGILSVSFRPLCKVFRKWGRKR